MDGQRIDLIAEVWDTRTMCLRYLHRTYTSREIIVETDASRTQGYASLFSASILESTLAPRTPPLTQDGCFRCHRPAPSLKV
jgi:hypothetical protein